MEGDKVLNDAYKAVSKALKDNMTGKVTIDYSKFDERTASKVRLALNKALQERKGELWKTLSGAK